MEIHQETFFRPPENTRERIMLRAEIYNGARLALTHSVTDCAFVPIRSMQYQAVITYDEIIFVDNQSYAVHNGEGGRLIVLAWDLEEAEPRDSLTRPVPVAIIYFQDDNREIHRRLVSELLPALDTYNARQRGDRMDPRAAKIIPLHA